MKIKDNISFVLPMYNEEDNIKGAIDQLKTLARDLTDGTIEIVVVDDASTDKSAEIVRAIAARDFSVKLFRMEKNTKFGGAFAKGLKSATGDVVLYMDSDMPVEIDDIKKSLPLIAESDIVTGYSKVEKGDTLKRKIMSGVYNAMVRALFGLDIKDINSGYKIMRRKVLAGIEFVSRSPFADVEIFIHARKYGFKVTQYPLVFRSRTGGRSYIARIPVVLATFADMLKVKVLSLGKNTSKSL